MQSTDHNDHGSDSEQGNGAAQQSRNAGRVAEEQVPSKRAKLASDEVDAAKSQVMEASQWVFVSSASMQQSDFEVSHGFTRVEAAWWPQQLANDINVDKHPLTEVQLNSDDRQAAVDLWALRDSGRVHDAPCVSFERLAGMIAEHDTCSRGEEGIHLDTVINAHVINSAPEMNIQKVYTFSGAGVKNEEENVPDCDQTLSEANADGDVFSICYSVLPDYFHSGASEESEVELKSLSGSSSHEDSFSETDADIEDLDSILDLQDYLLQDPAQHLLFDAEMADLIADVEEG
jgi:hypothetical protein